MKHVMKYLGQLLTGIKENHEDIIVWFSVGGIVIILAVTVIGKQWHDAKWHNEAIQPEAHASR